MIKINTRANSTSDSQDSRGQAVASETSIFIGSSKSFLASMVPFVLLILGIVAISSTAIFIKLAVRELSVEAILFDRLLIATIVFASWNWGWQYWRSRMVTNNEAIASEKAVTTTANQADQQIWMIMVLMLSLVILHLTGRALFMWSMTQTTAVNGMMLSNMTPIFTALGAWLFLGQRFDLRFLTGLTIAVGGAMVLTLGDWLHPEEQLFGTMAIVGDGAALLCSIFYAVVILLIEKLRQHLSTINFLVWRSAIGLVLIAPLVWLLDDSIWPFSATGWLAIIGLGLICGVIGHSLVVYSYKHFSSPFLAIVFLLEPVPTAIIAWLFLGEFLSTFNIMGFLLISGGIYLAKKGEDAKK
ncbi:MAG: DMT family transporter [Xenococcus sp. MO_188.B8]|nr:DMT family transporter [Xenococcus sp. MO_188.B8]